MNDFRSPSPVRRRLLKRIGLSMGATVLASLSLSQAAWAAKAPKSSVQYQKKPKKGKECKQCRFYIAAKGAGSKGQCKTVQGAIDPKGWCMLFQPKPGGK